MIKRGVGVAGIFLAGVTWAQVTERASVSSSGVQGNFASELPGGSGRMVSADGRYLAFMSAASNLVPGDTNGTWDVFLRDRLEGRTELISVATAGRQGNGISGLFGITISPDGRYVAFESRASNLISGDTNGSRDIFIRDRLTATTERVSVGTGMVQGNSDSLLPSISHDGRYVAFTSDATNLVPGDTNAAFDVFVRDRMNGTTERVSLGSGGMSGDLDSYNPCISSDGRWIVFESLAANLVPGDTNGTWDVFVRDRQGGTIERVSVSTGGAPGDQFSYAARISSDGRYVTFTSAATTLVPTDTNGHDDIFVRDRRDGTTERVSLATGGTQGDGPSGNGAISDDGRFVAFGSSARNLIPGGTNPGGNVFVRDRVRGATELVGLSTEGAEPLNPYCGLGATSLDGRYIIFESLNRDLVLGDSNGFADVFLHDRVAAGFTSLCDPSVGGVIGCPCSNPPSSSGRGCDNSSATGGAVLGASGIAYLSIDSLVFSTSGEMPTALSLLMQGTTLDATGAFHGQGVRCAAGPLKRLYARIAHGGGVTVPDLGAGEPTVSARSASMGDVILPGQSRWYFMAYRDPNVLGGCDAWKTFNATQTGQVSWWP